MYSELILNVSFIEQYEVYIKDLRGQNQKKKPHEYKYQTRWTVLWATPASCKNYH